MAFHITSLYALPLVAIWLVLWIRVSASRAKYGVSIGDGGSQQLLLNIRRHGNFIEWVPFVLLLMMLAEAGGASELWLHGAGILLLAGRLAHPFGLSATFPAHWLRYAGNGPNLLATGVLFIALLRLSVGL
ncbi:MAPEG family protein [Roseibium litorale]|uniref:MAPEG family protein n=1 Tax=Roseibium litorale TaxID=2803841 RepID=A0ABR9CH96_9HYPH|nr:MAPEG family protein [Roseibium litorale]MBD8890128.1 MAPEG family protein [Roseibium litorale]